MAKDREITIKVKLDGNNAVKGSAKVKQAVKGIDDQTTAASGSMKGFGLQTVATGAVAAVALNKIAEYGRRAVTESFRLATSGEEVASKYRTVLGPEIARANRFLEENTHMMGLSVMQGRELVARTTAIAQGFDFVGSEAADMGIEVVKLAGDLQSFNDVPIERTHNAITAALSGETEALKSLGIVIRQAEVNERALVNTGLESADALEQQHKATATLQLITEKAGVAVGDLERTQDSEANQARRTAAEYQTIIEILSGKLLPTYGRFISMAGSLTSTVLDWLQLDVVGELKQQRDGFNELYTRATNVNVSQAERVKLIRQMKQEYPDFLKGINAETVSNRELRDVLKEVNDEYAERIKIQQIIAPVQEAYQSAVEKTQSTQQKEGEMLIMLEKKYRENINSLQQLGFETDNWRERLQQMDGEQAQQELTKISVALRNWITESQAAERIAKSVVDQGVNPMTIALRSSEKAQSSLTAAREEAITQLKNLGFSQERINELLGDYQINAEGSSFSTQQWAGTFDFMSKALTGRLFPALDLLNKKTGGSGGLNEIIKEQQKALDTLMNKQGDWSAEEEKQARSIQLRIDKLKKLKEMRELLSQGGPTVTPLEADDSPIEAPELKLKGEDRETDPYVEQLNQRMLKEQEFYQLQQELALQRQTLKQAESEAVQQTARANIAALEREMAVRQQMAAIFRRAVHTQISSLDDLKKHVINTVKDAIKARIAEAVSIQLTKALSSVPFPFNVAAAAAAGATISGLFDAVIPDFNRGGVLRGPSHARGGIPVMNGGRQVAEAEGDEAFINKRSTRMYYDELSAINEAGGGRRFPGASRVVKLPASFEMGGPLGRRPHRPEKIDRAGGINTAIIAQAIREGMEGAEVYAPVQLRHLDEEQNDERQVQEFMGNKVR